MLVTITASLPCMVMMRYHQLCMVSMVLHLLFANICMYMISMHVHLCMSMSMVSVCCVCMYVCACVRVCGHVCVRMCMRGCVCVVSYAS